MVMHLDEQLLPYIMDVLGELKRGRRPKYGQFEEIIENTLPKACKAPSIYMERYRTARWRAALPSSARRQDAGSRRRGGRRLGAPAVPAKGCRGAGGG